MATVHALLSFFKALEFADLAKFDAEQKPNRVVWMLVQSKAKISKK